MRFPRFQLGKLDKNESARSLALKSGRLKKCLLALGGGGGQLPLFPPLATALVWIDGILYKPFSELGIREVECGKS